MSTSKAPTRTFSVVIPAYQAEQFISDALRSVLDQTPPPFEVIVVNDGSTDATADRLEAFGDQITVIFQPNRGEAAARNAGIRAAAGDFVVFCDADDEFRPGRLAALHGALDADPSPDVVTTNAAMLLDGVEVRTVYNDANPFPTIDQRREILRRNFVFGAVAARRSRLLDVGGYDETIRFATDWDLWLRMILTGSRVHFVDQPLSIYRLHENSLSNDLRAMSHGQLTLLQRALTNPETTPADHLVLRESISDARRELAIADLRAALRHGPADVRSASREVLRQARLRPRTRLVAMAGMATPRIAHRIVRRRRAGEPRRTLSGIALD